MKYKYAAVMLAIKNDFCLEESIVELFHQGVSKVLIISPTHYWADESPQAPADLEEIVNIAQRTGAHYTSLCLKSDEPINQAIYTEALYRNHAIARMGDDYDFYLTVDADEFWLPGTLEHIDSLASPETPTVCLPGIPVLGVPGLPVAGAKDTILVASSNRTLFQWGRSTKGPRSMGTIPVIHFSSTRRTLAEVVDKCLKSAHYPDPTYAFDDWLKTVLPFIKVGMRDVHMYKSPKNIWPEVRAWTKEEISKIPQSLHQYLDIAKPQK